MTKADKLYNQAVTNMEALYRKINSNIPDYDLFEIPIINTWAEYPKVSVANGAVSQKGLKSKGKHYRVVKLKYEDYAKLYPHTHYGYWEYIFVLKGVFKDINGYSYKPGDSILVDGYDPHLLECLTTKGELMIIFAKEKKYASIKYIREYLKKEGV